MDTQAKKDAWKTVGDNLAKAFEDRWPMDRVVFVETCLAVEKGLNYDG